MLWKILFRIFRRHLWLHLLIPLFMGSLFNAFVSHWRLRHLWRQFWHDWGSAENLLFAAGVGLTYLVIIYYQTKKETAVTIQGNELAVLDETLSTASDYFATGAIGLREWFDPIAQVFLSRIIRCKLLDPSFRDERVLLFATRRQVEALGFQHLDGYYAERLVDVHLSYGTPLAFLKPAEVREVLRELSETERQELELYPAWIPWIPSWYMRKAPLSWMIRHLDFAFVTHQDGSHSALLVRKEGETLRILHLDNEQSKPYEALTKLLQKRIYKSNGSPEINAAHDFTRYYHPHRAGPVIVSLEEINRRAYELYVRRGRHGGHAWEDWLRAESEIIRMRTL